MDKQKTEKTCGEQAALLSLIEMGLGSLLHSFKIPLSGQFLSLNQIAFMTHATKKSQSREVALQISLIASLLKSLSPAGKKLTPMLAILAQGFFYSVGVNVFGVNIFGILLGSVLSSLWAFIQPVLVLWLLFGEGLLGVAKHFTKELSKILSFDLSQLWPLVAVFIAVKVIAAICVSFGVLKMKDETFEEWQNKLLGQKPSPKKHVHQNSSAFILALKDLCTPLFLFSFVLTAAFLLLSHSSHSQIIWMLIRPLAVGFIIFFIVRVYPMKNVVDFFEKRGWHQLAGHFKEALTFVERWREK